MTPSPLASWVRSIAVAASTTVVALAVLIITAERVPALKDWLKATFTHHWLGKGALALALFVLLTLVLQMKRGESDLARLIALEAALAAVSVASIAGFFLLHLLHVI